MELAATALPAWVLCVGWVLALPVLAVAVVMARWDRLARDADAHMWCGGVLCLVALWQAHPAAMPGMHVHLLGVAAYALLVGPALALTGCALAVAAASALQHGTWLNAGVAYAVVALVPVAVAMVVRHALGLWLRAPRFVLALLTAWTSGALSFMASDVLRRAMAIPAASDALAPATDEVVTVIACLASAEAMLTGMVLTLFVVGSRASLHDLHR